MKKNNFRMLAFTLLSMMAINVSAHDIEVANADGVTIYYNYSEDGRELYVTFRGEKYDSYSDEYSGNVLIPDEVTYMGRTRKVTRIGDYAFKKCSSLTSVTIPNSVTSIGEQAFCYSSVTSVTIGNSVTSIGRYAFSKCSGLTSVTIGNSVTSIGDGAFQYCSGLTSVTIGNSVTSIGEYAFDGADLTSVVSLIENPFAITGKGTDGSPFTQPTFYNATLYVPKGTIEKYQSTDGWKDFVWIEEGTGEGGTTPGAKKCATPTISFADGKLTFDCETEGVSYTYEITNDDVKRGNASEVQLAVVYKVSVYATKYGYEDSDVATAEFTFGGNVDTGVRGDMNGDNIVNALDIQTIIMIAAML